MSSITFEVVYPHPPSKVWKALTDQDALAAWLMPNTFEPRVGHRFEFRSKPQPGWDGIVRCEVLEVDEPRRLSFTWTGGPLDTVLTFELHPRDGGTLLRMCHDGFQGFKAHFVRMLLKGGWKKMYRRRLPAVLARMDDAGAYSTLEGVPGCEESRLTHRLIKLVAPVFRRGQSRSSAP